MPRAKDTATVRHPDELLWNEEAKKAAAASKRLRAHAKVCDRCRRSSASPIEKGWCKTGLPLWRSAHVCYSFNGPRALVATIEADLERIARGPGHSSDRPAARRELAIRSGATLARYVYPKTQGPKGELVDAVEARIDARDVVEVFTEGPRLAPARAALLLAFEDAARHPPELRAVTAEELLAEVVFDALQKLASRAKTHAPPVTPIVPEDLKVSSAEIAEMWSVTPSTARRWRTNVPFRTVEMIDKEHYFDHREVCASLEANGRRGPSRPLARIVRWLALESERLAKEDEVNAQNAQ